MKRFNSRLFIVLTILFALLAYVTFREAYARDEGKIGASMVRNLLADMFNIMRFPVHILLRRFVINPLNFAIGLIVNCMIFSLCVERLLYLANRRKYQEEDEA